MFSILTMVFLYDLVSPVVYKFQSSRCNSSYYGETDRYLTVRSGEDVGIFPLTFGKVKLSIERSIRGHFLFCDHFPSSDDLTILAHGSNTF